MASSERSVADHLRYFAPAIALGAVSLKVLSVAAFSPQTSFALLASGASGSTFSLALALVPALLPVAIGMAARWLVDALAFRRSHVWPAVIVLSNLVILFLAVAPWWVVVVIAGLLLAVTPVIVRGNRRAKEGDSSAVVSINMDFHWSVVIAAFATFSALPVVLSPKPWLPSERLTIGSQSVVGYVLNDDGRWITVLDGEERLVSRYMSSSVRKRVVCRIGPDRPRTIAALFHEPRQYPKC